MQHRNNAGNCETVHRCNSCRLHTKNSLTSLYRWRILTKNRDQDTLFAIKKAVPHLQMNEHRTKAIATIVLLNQKLVHHWKLFENYLLELNFYNNIEKSYHILAKFSLTRFLTESLFLLYCNRRHSSVDNGSGSCL